MSICKKIGSVGDRKQTNFFEWPNQAAVEEEKTYVKDALEQCGYPDWALNRAIKTKDPPSTDIRQTQPGVRRTYVVIPYVSGLSERLKKNIQEAWDKYHLQTS